MRHFRAVIFTLVILLTLCTAATATTSDLAPAAAPSSEHADAAVSGGHEAKKADVHWTLFNYIPMEWMYPVAVAIGGMLGVPKADIDPHGFTAHALLHVLVMFFVLMLILFISLRVGGRYKKMLKTGNYDPDSGVTLTNFVETIIKIVLGMMKDIIGHDEEKYLPLVGSLAFVILLSNLLGLIPGFYTASDNLNTTLALALIVFCLYHYYGIRAQGIGKYLAHFLGPMEGVIKYVMAPIMVPIELISHLARPMSLSLRLFGNMFGDHKVFAVFMGLLAVPLIYPLPFLALGTLVAIVQTLVFSLLTMVYIGLATAKEH
ncbi:MAG: F0F1 ATP synthase subunit A [Candidatus Lernaella stagnicola]|nr:F0F1 ATP synthase subunit A [Candidatus Lernaella stagnicola]